jgi:sigma54-dependent transcription regulator
MFSAKHAPNKNGIFWYYEMIDTEKSEVMRQSRSIDFFGGIHAPSSKMPCRSEHGRQVRAQRVRDRATEIEDAPTLERAYHLLHGFVAGAHSKPTESERYRYHIDVGGDVANTKVCPISPSNPLFLHVSFLGFGHSHSIARA